ncbi:hypothetical protein ALP29_201660 [Pseudomonas syringae pv. avii]|uniref:Uncharacterized protein n=1 Tax=Pseudomonas syringae pv. avii TaxID=663959 RepID=A0A3M5VMQ5_PSESX|nr:hypothetical protein ALP43_200005 [Pseudomonas azotoformans]RMU59024.1 hypothetical protein ALP29_201660 [Pseudomonas syringae pv. avii]
MHYRPLPCHDHRNINDFPRLENPARFTDPLSPDIDQGRKDDELNLLYVAVTRGMKILALNSMVLSIMQRYVVSMLGPLHSNLRNHALSNKLFHIAGTRSLLKPW